MRKLRGKEIGFIFQDPLTSLNPTLTIGYQIAEAIREHLGLSPRRPRATASSSCSSKVGIPRARERLGDYPFQFSGGMRQRVMIAIALSCDPKLILADEPTTALDVTIQAQILELIQTLSDEFGTAVLMITHDLGIAAGMCDRVNVMYAGRIVETAHGRRAVREARGCRTRGACSIRCRGSTTSAATGCGRSRACRPLLIAPADACRFCPRCHYVAGRLPEHEPELTAASGDGHLARCWATEPGRVDRLTATPTERHRERAAAARSGATSSRSRTSRSTSRSAPASSSRPSGAGQGRRRRDFDVRRGETLGLVGESGCGKSTTGRALIRLREPTGGHGPFDGVDLIEPQARRAAHDAPPDADHLPGPVRLARPADDGRLDRRRADRDAQPGRRARPSASGSPSCCALVGLDPTYVNRYPHEFSGGQRQRIGVARALAVEPEFIVCDEPISALDVSIQAQVLNLLTDLRERLGLTYLFIAHDLSVVKHISDRVAVMYLGKIVEIGPPDQLYARARAPLYPGPPVGRAGARTRPPSASASGSSSRATCRARSTRRPAAASTPAAGSTSGWASPRIAGRSIRRSRSSRASTRRLPLRRGGAQDRRRHRPPRRGPGPARDAGLGAGVAGRRPGSTPTRYRTNCHSRHRSRRRSTRRS